MSQLTGELSRKNEFYITKERFYELKHFCRQYDFWKSELSVLSGEAKTPAPLRLMIHKYSDPTARAALRREFYLEKIDLIDKTATATDACIGEYIKEAVIKGISYDRLNARKPIPCCREKFYYLYRKFFFILSYARN